MRIIPAPNRILLEKPIGKTMTTSGLLLVEADLPYAYAVVWAVGKTELEVNAGDTIFYEPFSAQELNATELGGPELLFIRDESIIAIVPKETDNIIAKKGK